jgi:hypothetical protein
VGIVEDEGLPVSNREASWYKTQQLASEVTGMFNCFQAFLYRDKLFVSMNMMAF